MTCYVIFGVTKLVLFMAWMHEFYLQQNICSYIFIL